jgi:hypothetical protein
MTCLIQIAQALLSDSPRSRDNHKLIIPRGEEQCAGMLPTLYQVTLHAL